MEEGSFRIHDIIPEIGTVAENRPCVVAKWTGSIVMTTFFSMKTLSTRSKLLKLYKLLFPGGKLKDQTHPDEMPNKNLWLKINL